MDTLISLVSPFPPITGDQMGVALLGGVIVFFGSGRSSRFFSSPMDIVGLVVGGWWLALSMMRRSANSRLPEAYV